MNALAEKFDSTVRCKHQAQAAPAGNIGLALYAGVIVSPS